MKKIDWENLSFGYQKTDYNVRCYYRDGKWGEIEVSSDENINIHMPAKCLHYGQEKYVCSVQKRMLPGCNAHVVVL